MHETSGRPRGTWTLLIIALVLTSCTSFRVVKPEDVLGSLKPGDTIKVVTRDGRESKFEIVSVTPDALVGKDYQIALADIKEVEKRETDPAKTTGLVAGTVIGVPLAFFTIGVLFLVALLAL